MNKIIALADIRIDGDTQARTSLHDATVAEYADALTDGATLPPIVVFFDGAHYWLADGFHRYMANQRIGAVSLAADVRNGALTDAQLYAYGANQAHGLRRSNDDKRKAVLGTLALRPDWSDRAIAKHVGVHHQMVANSRASLDESSSEKSAERTYTTKHGTTATMDTSGQKKAGKTKKGQAKPQGTSTATEAAASSTPEQRAPGQVTVEQPADAEGDVMGGLDPLEELERMQAQIDELTAQVKVAEADDQKAEALKWRQMYEHARRSQADAMDHAARSAKELDGMRRDMQAIGRAVGEQDLRKVVRAVQAFVRQHKVEA